jgi:PhnB protein
MAKTSTYLNFARESFQAFEFYKSVFGTEYVVPPVRFGDLPPMEGMPPLADEDRELIMNIQLPITGGHILMSTDAPASMGFKVNPGNNVYICIDPDTRAEADSIFARLSEGGNIEMDIAEQFWGDYFGSFQDKFGTNWMIACTSKV